MRSSPRSADGRYGPAASPRRDVKGPDPPLVGRSDDLAALDAVLAAAAAGRGGVAIVEGEAGVGKTRLVHEALAGVPATLTVLVAEGDEAVRGRPFGMVTQALAQAGIAPGDLPGPAGSATASPLDDAAHAEGRYRLLDATLTALEALAADHPLVVVAEDAHWADSASILVLERLARRARHLAVSAVLTCRPSPRPPGLDRLADLVDDLGGCHLRLGRLALADVADLVESVTGVEPAPSLLAAVERGAGNPLYCLELLAALDDAGVIVRRDGRAEVAGPVPLADRLRKLVGRRLRALPADAQHALRAASVLGTAFTLDDLAVTLDQPASDLLRTLAEPLASGIVGEAGERLRFRHAVVREACYEGLPAAARTALHLQAARALAAAGRPAPDVARHYLRGASPGDGEAIRWLVDAGRQASARAPEVAVELLDGALALAGDAGNDRDALHAERGMALMWSGRVAEGEAALRALLEHPHDPAVDAPARLALGQSLLLQARGADAAAVLEGSGVHRQVAPTDEARLLADAAVARLLTADVDAAQERADRAREAAARAADVPAQCVALSVLAAVRGLQGRTCDGIALAEEAVEIALASPSHEIGRRPPHLFLTGLLVEVDRLEEAQKAVDVARRTSEDSGAVWVLPVAHTLSARGHFSAGDLADAETEAEAALAQAEEVGTLVLRVWAHAIRAHILLHRDDLAAAEAALEAGERDLAVYGVQVQGTDWHVWARALLAEATGDAATALALLRAVWAGHATYGIRSERRLIGPDYVRLCLQAGERDEARAVAAAVGQAAADNGSASARGAALRCRGLAESDPDVLLRAVQLYGDAPRRLEHAAACEDAAGVLVAAGRADEARALLADARGIVEARGAARAAARVDQALRDLGVRRGRRGPRSRPTQGWEALTETEVRVTDLVAEGLTNPQIGARMFISRRTVETHVSHVFAKLEVSSRVELAALVAGRRTSDG